MLLLTPRSWRSMPSLLRSQESNCPDASALRQHVQITRATGGLLRWSRRRHPRRVIEIEELGHVDLCRVALGERGHPEARFNQLQDCSVISRIVIHIMLLRIRRDHSDRHPISRISEVAIRTNGTLYADVPWFQVDRLDAIRTYGLLRGHVVVKTSGLVIGQDECGVLP